MAAICLYPYAREYVENDQRKKSRDEWPKSGKSTRRRRWPRCGTPSGGGSSTHWPTVGVTLCGRLPAGDTSLQDSARAS